jgi:ABC-type multidrug transport system ATPase subunit
MNDLVIQTDGLSKAFQTVKAVDDVDLKVEKGSIYAFLGPNGAGKTTTIRMLLGLLTRDSGEISLFGEPHRGSLGRLSFRIGSMVEGPSLYPHMTGEEQLTMFARLLNVAEISQRVGFLLKMLNLQDAQNRLVKEYSLGMK